MRIIILVVLITVLCASAQAQAPVAEKASPPADAKVAEQAKVPDETKTSSPQAAEKQQTLTAAEPGAVISQERIPSGARIYVAPMVNGFDNYVVAGLQQKKVPVTIVADRAKAEFEITGVAETDKAGWAKMLFMGSDQTNETASVKMVNLKTGNVVFAYSVKKGNSVRGKQSAGESCAKHIKEKIID